MRYLNSLLLLVLAGGASTAALAESERRDLDGFTAIDVENGIDLELTQGDFLVEVEADDDDLENIITEVRNGTLRLRLTGDAYEDARGGWFGSNRYQRYRARITLPVLESVEASGGSDLRSRGVLQGDALEIEASGGSDVDIEVDLVSLEIRASGGSDLDLAGKVGSLEVKTSGGSDMDARDLDARDVELEASGGSDARVSVTGRLSVRASGGSDVTYYGDPEQRDIDNSGSSDVDQRSARFSPRD